MQVRMETVSKLSMELTTRLGPSSASDRPVAAGRVDPDPRGNPQGWDSNQQRHRKRGKHTEAMQVRMGTEVRTKDASVQRGSEHKL
ncbi:MAG: hypothetical protein RMN51_12975 [Verrucomicrobiota bacterium]|nr:hypothetical protein [Limisphaera sp.]MDW8383007.1 hypothetical protein [Verrucomicrobiota bacterium]